MQPEHIPRALLEVLQISRSRWAYTIRNRITSEPDLGSYPVLRNLASDVCSTAIETNEAPREAAAHSLLFCFHQLMTSCARNSRPNSRRTGQLSGARIKNY
eukprot:scaffold112758_cov29-Tisochrysis_lutea.AAC.4